MEQPNSNNAYQLSIKDKVFSEQVKILHDNLLTSVPANFVGAFIVFMILYQGQTKTLISVWFAAVAAVSLFRMFAVYLFRYRPKNNNWHLAIFLIGVTLSAAMWGAINSVFMPNDDLMHQMVIIVITAGVTAGGVQTLNANLKASLTYLCIIGVPLAIWIFLQGGFAYTLLGITVIAYISFMVVTSIRGYKLLATALYLQYENQALIKEISDSNAKLMDDSKALYEQSIHDSLTGLFNRRYLDETLPRELQRTIREKQSLCVAMLDLDFFKSFNDTHGHAAGDEVLKFIGDLLQDVFRGSDISCRFGGEEFLVVMINTDMTSAHSRLEQFRELVKKGKVYFHGHPLPPMTVSIGVAEAPGQGMTIKEIIHAADLALYSAKDAGRDRTSSFFFL